MAVVAAEGGQRCPEDGPHEVLVPPRTIARLVLPAVFMRLVMPTPAGATTIPATSVATSSTVIDAVLVLRASAKAPVAYSPELLAVIGVVVVHVVEDT